MSTLNPRRRGIFLATLLVAVALVSLAPSFAQAELPRGRYVYDNASVIPDDTKAKIEKFLLAFDKNTTDEIVVYTLPKISGHGIKDRSGTEITDPVALGVYIFNELPLPNGDGQMITGIGKKGKDNGVLLLVTGVAPDATSEDRHWKIEVGYGLEPYITDAQAGHIGDTYLAPNLKAKNYSTAFLSTVQAIAGQITGAPFGQTTSSQSQAELPDFGQIFQANSGYIASIALAVIVLITLAFASPSIGAWNETRSGRNSTRKYVASRVPDLEKKIQTYKDEIAKFDDDLPHLPSWAATEVRSEMSHAQMLLNEVEAKTAEAKAKAGKSPYAAADTLKAVQTIGAEIDKAVRRVFVTIPAEIKNYKEEAPRKLTQLAQNINSTRAFLNKIAQQGFQVNMWQESLNEAQTALDNQRKALSQTALEYKAVCDRADQAISKVQKISEYGHKTVDTYTTNNQKINGIKQNLTETRTGVNAAKDALTKLTQYPKPIWTKATHDLQHAPALLDLAEEHCDKASKLNTVKNGTFDQASAEIEKAAALLQDGKSAIAAPADKLRRLADAEREAKSQIQEAGQVVAKAQREVQRDNVHSYPRQLARDAQNKYEDAKAKMSSGSILDWLALLALIAASIAAGNMAIQKAKDDIRQADEEREEAERRRRRDTYWSSSSHSSDWGSGGGGGFGGGFGGGGGSSGGGGAGGGW